MSFEIVWYRHKISYFNRIFREHLIDAWIMFPYHYFTVWCVINCQRNVCTCVYVCVYVCVRVCTPVCTPVCTYMWVCVRVCGLLELIKWSLDCWGRDTSETLVLLSMFTHHQNNTNRLLNCGKPLLTIILIYPADIWLRFHWNSEA